MAVLTFGRACRARAGLVLVALALTGPIARASVVVDGTRVVYPANRREVSVNLHNVGEAPSLVEVWIDAGDPHSTPNAAASNAAADPASPAKPEIPIVATPPLFRLNPAQGQTLRLIYTQNPLPVDRETVFWLNVLDIPPRGKPNPDAPNQLEMAFRHRLKVFFRPPGLHGDPADAAKAVVWSIAGGPDGLALIARNPTPYYISFVGADVKAGLLRDSAHADMLAPNSAARFALTNAALRTASPIAVHYSFINDYGAIVSGDAVAGSAP